MGLGLWNSSFIKKKEWEEIYKRKLGEDYFDTDRSAYSIIISNHTSWTDAFTFVSLLVPSFVAKQSVREMPLFGTGGKLIGCLFINRNDSNSKVNIVKFIN